MIAQEIDEDGRSELHHAVIAIDLGRVRAFISKGCNVNLQDKNGWSPLHIAAQENALEIAKLLLESGAIVDSIDCHGNTPMLRAVFCSKGEGSLVELLRENGADPYSANNEGQTPLRLARVIKNSDLAKCFDDLPYEK